MSDLFIPGSIKPEADYLELERLSTKLGIPVPMMFVTVEATNPDGSPGERYHDRSRTWNRNFWNQIFSQHSGMGISSGTFGSGVLSVKTYGGATQAISGIMPYGCTGEITGAINSAVGIVVGTGTTAESFEHTALASLVAQGSSSGQLTHEAVTNPTASYDSGTKVWTATPSRIFNNNSGGTIVIAETALYTTNLDGGGSSYTCMTERSLLGSTVSVLAAGQLTVTYTITLTFPA